MQYSLPTASTESNEQAASYSGARYTRRRTANTPLCQANTIYSTNAGNSYLQLGQSQPTRLWQYKLFNSLLPLPTTS